MVIKGLPVAAETVLGDPHLGGGLVLSASGARRCGDHRVGGGECVANQVGRVLRARGQPDQAWRNP
jgi:hypothetical protein